LSSGYATLYRVASASLAIDDSNPLAGLAKNQLRKYDAIRSFIRDNALDLMNGSTAIPDYLLQAAISSNETASADETNTRATEDSQVAPVPAQEEAPNLPEQTPSDSDSSYMAGSPRQLPAPQQSLNYPADADRSLAAQAVRPDAPPAGSEPKGERPGHQYLRMKLTLLDTASGAPIIPPAQAGKPVTLQVRVFTDAGAASKVSGSVRVIDHTKPGHIWNGVVDKGVAKISLGTLAVATTDEPHRIEVQFLGTGDYLDEETADGIRVSVISPPPDPEQAAENDAKAAAKTITVVPTWIDPKSDLPIPSTTDPAGTPIAKPLDQCKPVLASVEIHGAGGAIVKDFSGTVTFATADHPASGEDKNPGSSLNVTITKGRGTAPLPALAPGVYNFMATLIGTDQYKADKSQYALPTLFIRKLLGPSDACIYSMPPLFSTVVGVDVEGASSTSPAARFWGNVSVDEPIFPQKHGSNRLTDISQAKLFLGGSLRIAAMAQPGQLSASELTSGYLATAVNATPDKIVQSWEGTGSMSFKILSTNLGIGTFDNGSPTSKSYPRKTLLTTSILASGGFISPLSASQANPAVYYATNQIINDPSIPPTTPFAPSCTYTSGTPPCYFSFVPTDRERFYRHYEIGFRFRTYGEDFENHVLRFPGIMDLTVGQNEYVTAGKLNGVVVHFGGSLPIPIPKVPGIYAFGAIDAAINGPSGGGAQLLLEPVPSTANVTYLSPSVYEIPVSQPNRDRYRFGVGVDLYHLITAKQQKQGTSSSSASGQTN
jgi:hypothetical protein